MFLIVYSIVLKFICTLYDSSLLMRRWIQAFKYGRGVAGVQVISLSVLIVCNLEFYKLE